MGNATTEKAPGTSQRHSCTRRRAKAKAKDFNGNASTAEKWTIQPASAPRTEELGAKEDTKKPGAREDIKERAKAFGKLTETTPKEVLTGTSRWRRNQRARRRTLWIKTGTKLSERVACWATSCRRSSPWTASPMKGSKSVVPSRDQLARGSRRQALVLRCLLVLRTP